jgi:pimeloyl-ACP methyl ester carboxylesterase
MRPPVVLVHGFASHFAHDWLRTGWVDIFEERGRVVRPVDLPGHGSEPEDPERVTPAAAVQAAAGSGPVDAVGFSAGGRAVLAAAMATPTVFRRLALLGLGSVGGSSPRAEAVAAGMESADEPTDRSIQLLRRLADSAGNDRSMLARFLRRRAAGPDRERLAQLRLPVLLVVGDRDVTISGSELADLLPTAELLVLEGVDHPRTLTDIRCIDAVVDFLER